MNYGFKDNGNLMFIVNSNHIRVMVYICDDWTFNLTATNKASTLSVMFNNVLAASIGPILSEYCGNILCPFSRSHSDATFETAIREGDAEITGEGDIVRRRDGDIVVSLSRSSKFTVSRFSIRSIDVISVQEFDNFDDAYESYLSLAGAE